MLAPGRSTSHQSSSLDDSQTGFTLIELLVVMIIVGVLAAIAIPLFLNQKAKAHDTSTKADVTNVGKEVATYFVDPSGPVVLDYTSAPGSVLVTGGGGYTATVRLTKGTAEPSSRSAANLADPNRWCVALTDDQGVDKTYRYSALGGLEALSC